MLLKRFVPCIYLWNGLAVRSFSDKNVVETDPLRLVHLYNENNADELIVFDMSEDDAAHEIALDIMKEICALAEVDVIGAGNIMRKEDVKELLYAGCKRVVLDYEKEENIAITEKAALRFGREKLLVSYNDPLILSQNKELLEQYVSGLVLMNPHQIRETIAVTDLPLYVQINNIALNKLMEIFAYDNVCGVTGNAINDNYKDILSLKNLCKENGIQVELFEEACHTGAKNYFYNEIIKKDYRENENSPQVLQEVYNMIRDMKVHPSEGSYTNYLFDKGLDKVLKKLGEEATEIVIAAKNPGAGEVKCKISDFLYHMMVLMVEKDISWEEIITELVNR